MNATIITIGDELLIGQVVDTNSAWMATELTKLGFTIENHISISDTGDKIRSTIDRYLPENDLIIFTGGLGPTNDDITKKVLTEYFNSSLVLSEDVLSAVEAKIKSYGSTMNDLNREQALVPAAAKVLMNNHGTAPGMWFEKDGRVVISLPGVPSEMKGIFNDHIKRELGSYFSLPHIIYKTIMVSGISEAHLAEKLSNWEAALPAGVSLAYLPSPEAIRLRLGAKGVDEASVLKLLDEPIKTLHDIIARYIYGYDNETLEEVIGRMIAERGSHLACAESCTGGTIAQRITAIPGCSKWFKGGAVVYSNEVKSAVLGVEAETLERFGAVSEETVTEMVKGAQKVFGAEYAVATSGIAGPTGGSSEKPVGTVWTAAAGPGFIVTKKFNFGKNRTMNIRRSTAGALSLLQKAINCN
ncbi:MAG: competence/damage-inducible protein A [Spirochaetales bacterium]|uniref:CinA-like protein n=1 Tax=Candidatus Thalassospirochaeta sargassi TaxID=3119039 RepID=A0AAJ1MKG4_9SPIO|nr:competence/damage-inducible protein A [Spirochaetales bacterium]